MTRIKGNIYAIVDTYEFALKALKSGIKIIQYRNKKVNNKEFLETAKKIRATCLNKAIFIINDRFEIAKKIKPDGVHLGQKDMDFRKALKYFPIVGVSTHNVNQAVYAEKNGATYIGVGPIFSTPTKPDRPAISIKELIKIKKKTNLPLVAIGGITEKNLPDVIKAGADSAAFITELKNAKNLEEKVNKLYEITRGTVPPGYQPQ